MDAELEKSLRHMQQNPTTGIPHNQQVISTQVENVIATYKLIDKIKDLERTLDKSGKRSQILEQSNYKLQRIIVALTSITTIIAVYEFLSRILPQLLTVLTPFLKQIPGALGELLRSSLAGVIASLVLSLVSGIITYIKGRKFTDTIVLKDHLQMIVRDKEGKIKEMRSL